METTVETVNAIIESARIGFERGFILDSWLSLDYSGSGQGFGGYVLGGFSDGGKCPAAEHGHQPNFAAEWIVSVMRAADVENWADLKGKCVRVRRESGFNGRILGIGHITRDDRWFMPRDRFAALIKKLEDHAEAIERRGCTP
jgi:hypothetical protein